VRLGALFSGGKDSTYSILKAVEMGHEVSCLIIIHPAADDSLLFHYPNSKLAEMLAAAMGLPKITSVAAGVSKEDEMACLQRAITDAQAKFGIEGVVFGGISSKFQKSAVEAICSRNGLSTVAPIWGLDPARYMQDLLARDFKMIIVGVSAMGLGKEWLGQMIDAPALAKLGVLSERNGFNLNFEGGEAETLVIDCPLFRRRLEVRRASTLWDGQRGIFEIQEAALVEK
jgi:ABC transporter with metal-binding/Fe-S-binding domain ATP-binding protein